MKIVAPTLRAVCACILVVALAACGGSLPGGGMGNDFRSAVARNATGGRSWMLPEAKKQDLVYAYDASDGDIYVLSYPKGKLVGTLSGFDSPEGACADASGNVWIANYSSDSLIEYAHGGTQPIATLQEGANAEPQACSIDPTTGNLAVTNRYPTVIAVFAKAHGNPTMYSLDGFTYWATCAYDNAGNLFASDWANPHAIAELPHGSSTLTEVRLAQRLRSYGLQWDGAYLAVHVVPKHYGGPTRVARLRLRNGVATIAGSTFLTDRDHRQAEFSAQFFVGGGRIVGPDRLRGAAGGSHAYSVDIWRYPRGGAPITVMAKSGRIDGVVLSRAPRR